MEEAFEMKKKTTKTSAKKKSQGICYFLLSLLEDESYPHVQWTNKEKGEFQIHWVHASSGTWEMNTDAETFRLWAMAKGKLEGRENKNKTWKANFRCAMKSRSELQEIKLPKDSPLRKKNLKFWKFVDIDIVKGYKGGRNFDWHHPRTKSLVKKSPRVQPLRSTQNRTITEIKEEIQTSHSHPDSQTTAPDERETIGNPEEEEGNDYGAGLLQIIDSHNDNGHSVGKNTPFEGRLQIDMDDDSNFNSYSAGLIKIIERREEDNESAMPNVPPGSYGIFSPESFSVCRDVKHKVSEIECFSPCSQQPIFQQMSSTFCGDQTFPETKLVTKEWELFMDEYLGGILEKEGMVSRCFQFCNETLTYNDVSSLCNDICNQL